MDRNACRFLSQGICPRIVRSARRLIAVILFIAVTASISGCTWLSYIASFLPFSRATRPGETLPPMGEVRTREEVYETGPTADDVLAAYDQFVSAAFHYNDAIVVENLGDEYIGPSVVCFKDVSTPRVFLTDEDGNPVRDNDDNLLWDPAPYYCMSDWYTSSLLGDHYNLYKDLAYIIGITWEIMYDPGYIYDFCSEIIIPADVFQNYAKSFQQTPIRVDQGFLDDINRTYPNMDPYFVPDLDSIVYKAFSVDRNTIENATPEQLLVLYTMLEDIITINFPGYDQYVQENDVNYSD